MNVRRTTKITTSAVAVTLLSVATTLPTWAAYGAASGPQIDKSGGSELTQRLSHWGARYVVALREGLLVQSGAGREGPGKDRVGDLAGELFGMGLVVGFRHAHSVS